MNRRVMLLIVLLAALGGISYPLLLHRTPWLVADETMYARAAWNLVHRGLLIPDVPGTMNYPPLYAAVLAPASLLPDIRATYVGYQMINVALWLAGGLLAYCIARRTATGVPPPLVTAVALATPAALTYVPLVMSENLSLLLVQCAAFALFRATTNGSRWWFLAGWGASLALPFCRVTGIVVPLAFLVGQSPVRGAWSKTLRGLAVGLAAVAIGLLIFLPTSILKVYHPLSVASVAAKTLRSAEGWVTLARSTGTTFAFLLVGSVGMVWSLRGGAAQERPIRRFLAVIVIGQALMTIAYMQYGSASPHAETYRALGRYIDPGIAAAMPWLLCLRFHPRRIHVIGPAIGAALALLFWPHGGFKPGQTLSFAGLGLAALPFRSILGLLPMYITVPFLSLAPMTVFTLSRGRGRVATAAVSLVLLLLLSHDALTHVVAMSRQRETTESELWRLHAATPRNVTIVVQRSEFTTELWTALYSGLFWLPSAEVRVADHAVNEDPDADMTVALSRDWRPDLVLHAGSHSWFCVGESPPPVEETTCFYDFGPSMAGHIFSALPADDSHARWSGESPVIELRVRPADSRITIGLNRSQLFGASVAKASLNGHFLGELSSADSVVCLVAPARTMRPDGRQLLALRVSPLEYGEHGQPWLNGLRLDWLAVSPIVSLSAASADSPTASPLAPVGNPPTELPLPARTT